MPRPPLLRSRLVPHFLDLDQILGFRVLRYRISTRRPFLARQLDGARIRRKLSQLVTDHVLGDGEGEIVLAVVDLELEPDKVGQDGGRAGLRADRRNLVALLLGPHDGQSEREEAAWLGGAGSGCVCGTATGQRTDRGLRDKVRAWQQGQTVSVGHSRTGKGRRPGAYLSTRIASAAGEWAASSRCVLSPIVSR